MKLSIVIVNYNVAALLEQCLHSVRAAAAKVEGGVEVWVVDNASVDGSVEMLRERFDWVRLIASERNLGFSAGNNLAIRQCTGTWILLLNPDTILPEDALVCSLAEAETSEDIGGLGIRMLNQQGYFLPESKRGLPKPMSAFYKFSGLIRLFPRSKRFAHYYLGHLDPEQNADVEVLSGAYMLLRKSALDQIGTLDERFFMYGEDIDLSYRLLKAGYRNRYLSHPSIVHYKGESTRKASLRYVYVFYQAMALFVQKHPEFSGGGFFTAIIHASIWMRASFGWLSRIARKTILPIADAGLMYAGMAVLTRYWELNHRFVRGGGYPPEFLGLAVPVYIAVWMMSAWLSGAYDRPVPRNAVWRGVGWGSLLLLSSYALLDESWRFSRALLLLGSGWALFEMQALRLLTRRFDRSVQTERRGLISAEATSLERFKQRMHQAGVHSTTLFELGLEQGTQAAVERMREAITVLRLQEVLLDGTALGGSRVLEVLRGLSGMGASLKIVAIDGVGAFSGGTYAEFNGLGMTVNRLDQPSARREKRLFDVLSALLILAFSPVLALRHSGRPLVRKAPSALLGQRTWVGLTPPNPSLASSRSPRTAVYHPAQAHHPEPTESVIREHLELGYLRDYRWMLDARVLWNILKMN
ncbi:glycosyltransferase [bacterium]|nr:glycosyltransferase [bacterium]